MEWKRKELDAVLYAVWKVFDEAKPHSERWGILHKVFRQLGAEALSEQPFTITVDTKYEKPVYVPPDFQSVVDSVRARRSAQREAK